MCERLKRDETWLSREHQQDGSLRRNVWFLVTRVPRSYDQVRPLSLHAPPGA